MVFNRKQLKQQLKAKAKNKGGKGGNSNNKDGDPHENNALLRIMHHIGVRGEPFVCDLTSSSKENHSAGELNSSSSSNNSGARGNCVDSRGGVKGGGLSLPSGLSVFFAEVMQRSKDAYLYHFLLLNQER